MSAVAISAMTKVMQETHGNPSSIHGHGRQAGKLLREARQELAQLLGTKPQHIFFTSGGTEGNNTAIIGYCLRHQEQGKHIITTAIEHHAVLETIDYLVQHFGFEVTIIQPENQEITAQQIQKALRDDTILVSTMFANNETGNLLPIAEIGQILKQHPAAYHVDAVQALAKIPTEEYLTDRVDFATFSSHKFHGVRGVGFVYIKSGKKICPLLNGGGQESDKRSTTENLAGIAAMAKALRLSIENLGSFTTRTAKMKGIILEELAKYPDVTIFSGTENFAPHILTFGIKGVRGEVVVHAFEEYGIYVSTTSACSSRVKSDHHSLAAMGVPQNLAQSALRFSLAADNSNQDIEKCLVAIPKISQQFEKTRGKS